ncbi:MAG: ribosome maturation factor RimM [Candidatus Methylomirabilis sp.]|nr:ribosome maturation factor RimM [Deltaproteobacteria bacterium]
MKRKTERGARDSAESPSPEGEPVALGRITKPHGLGGACRVRAYGDGSLLLSSERLWVHEASGWRPLTVEGVAPQGAFLLLRFKEIASVEAAETLRGLEIGVPRAEFPEAGPEEHYWADLIGLDVYEEGAAEPRGAVAGLMPMPGADNLVIRDRSGAEWMLPFIDEYVAEVDAPGGRIVVRIPEGLLE